MFAFTCMQAFKFPSNIMRLAGIAVAIGSMVDMGIVMLENIYQYLTDHRDEYTRVVTDADGRSREVIDFTKCSQYVAEGATDVGSAILSAVSTTVISFLPVFFLEGRAAKLFTPPAWTKTFCMVGAVILALTDVLLLASELLRSRQTQWPTTLKTGIQLGGAFTSVWFIAERIHASFASFTVAIEQYFGLTTTSFVCMVGMIVAVISVFVPASKCSARA